MAELASRIKLTEYQHFGGNFFNSVAHAKMFRDDKPFDFGVKTSRIFSSEIGGNMVNKKFTWLTMARGNYYALPPGTDEYVWSVAGDAKIDFRITQLLEPEGSQLGKNKSQFRIALDKNWAKPPVALKTESDNAPLIRIVSEAEPLGPDSFAYLCELQDGNPNAWISTNLVDVGSRLTRVSSPVPDEDNQDYAPDEYGQMMKLRGQTGQFANKVEFTDKFIRKELSAMRKGSGSGQSVKFDGRTISEPFSNGYIYQAGLRKPGSNQMIEKGVFISKAEARLLERSEADREYMMEFGRYDVRPYRDTDATLKVAPGWRQIVRDGQYYPHNGSFTLAQLYDFIHQIVVRRRDFMNREIYLVSGSGGINYISELIQDQASVFQTVEPGLYIRNNKDKVGVHPNELEFGAQFTRIIMAMGVTIRVVYDPMKDDDSIYTQTAPGSYLPLESFNYDILEFGKTENAAENASGENITMVVQEGVEEYYSVFSVVDPKTGTVKDGSNVFTNNKRAGIYRTLGGSLAVWDVSAVGRIEWVIDNQ
jgi:hypothetical protein